MPILETGNHYQTSSEIEELLDEWTIDVGALPGIAATLTAYITASAGTVGTFRVKAGGQLGAPDGVIVAQIVTGDVHVDPKKVGTGKVSAPARVCSVKLTGMVSTSLGTADINGAVIDVEGAVIVRNIRASGDGGLGEDVWLDVVGSADPNLVVAPHGDWLTVRGLEAYRQSLLRRFITEPGEWATKPGYGAGARKFTKKINTRSGRDQMMARLRAQALQDPRTASVEEVKVEPFGDGGVRASVRVIPKGHGGKPLTASMEIT